jgi:hypothetical protein
VTGRSTWRANWNGRGPRCAFESATGGWGHAVRLGLAEAFPRAFERLFSPTRPDDLLDLEFNILCKTERYPMLEVPILSTRRRSGQSTTTWRSAVRLYWGAYHLWRAQRKGLE